MGQRAVAAPCGSSAKVWPPCAFKGAATRGVSVACALVFVMHACLCLCRLLQHPCRKTEEINKGDGRSSRSRSSRSLQLVEAGPRVLTPERFPLLGGCRPRGSPRLWGAVHASSNASFESSWTGVVPPTGSVDLNVASCMTPTVRSLDGVARALHCVELKPCRLHVVLLR